MEEYERLIAMLQTHPRQDVVLNYWTALYKNHVISTRVYELGVGAIYDKLEVI